MRRTAVVSAFFVLTTACGGVPASTDEPTTVAVEASTSTLADTTTTTALPTTTMAGPPLDGGAAPWSASALAVAAVPTILADEWNAAENRSWCSALFPTDPPALAADGSVRAAKFSGGWSVAWDRPAGPGRLPSGEYCADCGRGAFGLAGVGVRAQGDEADRWPTLIGYSDGSQLGYGYEGDADATAGAPLLAYLLVQDEGCLYNVWSFLGEDHLLDLIGQLRRVEGLEGEPTPWLSALPFSDFVDLGDPPWAQAALPLSGIPGPAREEWAEAGSPPSCPMLFFTDLGAAGGATARRAANSGEMLVAWDLPGAPGHNGDSTPCEDCGRGVIGLGTFPSGSFEGPVAYTWSDGSEARLRTGPFSYGVEAFVRISGFACDYWVWSHLGEEHLVDLLTNLRRVEGAP